MQGSSLNVNRDNIQSLTYYEIFSLDPSVENVDLDMLQRAYRRFALLFHPDKDASPEAHEAFLRVKLAAETLSDAQKRREYNEQLRQEALERQGEHNRQQQNHQKGEVDEEVLLADMILRQKEAESLAKMAAANKELEEREAAARKMIHELTDALTTPFKQMESVLVHEWDIDQDLLDMKVKEVNTLLQRLREYDSQRSERKGGTVGAVGTKRDRVDD
uniref:Putative chaperone protein DNAj n=1 Tax=Trypanosoma congolense (strain IL3000) TaxID=1068625 RepID=G0UJC8_TRYCI|nr:putative chaperone protein DNAj [Trypanosoma congolense IL3000]